MPAPQKKSPAKKKGKATPADERIGRKLRQRRILVGLSQEKLAKSVGVTFQQIQKYENGSNRLSASRLQQICRILGVPSSFFLEDEATNSNKTGLSEGKTPPIIRDDLLESKETFELLHLYYSIKNPTLRKNLFNLLKSMAEKTEDEGETDAENDGENAVLPSGNE